MILEALVDYYETLLEQDEENKVQKPGYSKARVSYALNLSLDGEIKQVIPLKVEVEQGKKMVERPREFLVPEQAPRASGVSANFLCDNTSYLLGIDLKGKPQRSVECFEASKTLTLDILDQCYSDAAIAIKNYFMMWDPKTAMEHSVLAEHIQDMMAGANLIFFVNGISSLTDNDIFSAWESYIGRNDGDEKMRCLVTGKMAPVTILHPKIKGVVGAQAVGANLVSFNGDAYESYDREQGMNAPIGKYASFAYGAALNELLSNRKNRQKVGDMTIVFWSETAKAEYVDLFSQGLNSDGDSDEVLKDVSVKLALGEPIGELNLNSKFYVLGLSPNAARVSVRFFLRDGFGKILANMLKHQERLQIIKAEYERSFISLYHLLMETVNPNSKDKMSSPVMSGAMLRAILLGTDYPRAFYNGLLMRAKAEKDINSRRAAGIKAYLLNSREKSIDKEVFSVKVNEETTNRAYVLGRLFAVLERAQEEASPGINSTIKDRYFSSASATPGIVFPRLLRLAVFHNAKSEYGANRDSDIGKLMNMLDVENQPFPNHQSLQEQGIFMLGYYQQRQQRYEKKEKGDK